MTHPASPLATRVADLAAEVETLRATAESGIDLATRLDTVEHDLVEMLARVDHVATLATLAHTGPAPAGPSVGYQYATLTDWVDEVFARLAARHHARWCPNWAGHLEATARLQLLWHTWEASHVEPATYPARDEWMRVVFDHHAPWLLDREGPFAGCSAERCAQAPHLPQQVRDLERLGDVTPLDAYRRSELQPAEVAR